MTKPFYQSATILGAALALAAAILAALGHGDASATVGVIATTLVTGGRARASTALTVRKRPAKPRKGHTLPPVLLVLGILLAACASSPEQQEARRAHAIETAATLSTCAVDQGLGGCAPQLAVLVGCAVRSESSCAVPRRAWSLCLAAQATGCGLAALTAYVAGATEGPEVTMLDPCAVDAAEACVAWADQPEGLEACYARELVVCVE